MRLGRHACTVAKAGCRCVCSRPVHLRKERNFIKHISQTSGLLDEVEGIVQGHRDGHGFVSRDDGAPDIYLPPNEMRAVLHKDRV